jgi:hypothetical protein
MFKDESGKSVSFTWWIKWKIAKWHWRQWLLYEGMPKQFKSVHTMDLWQLKLIEVQNRKKEK